MSEVVLIVGGKKYSSIKELTITKSLENLAHSFSLEYVWQDFGPFPLRQGNSCSIEIQGKKYLTGYINRVAVSFDSKNKSIRIDGRSKTSDLIDCSWTGESDEFNGTHSLWSIASILCKPFDVTVLLGNAVTSKKVTDWKIDPGEPIFESLDKLARIHGMFWQTDSDGNIFLSEAGKKRSSGILIEGDNIIKGNAIWDDSDHFSEYHCKAQVSSSYDNELQDDPEEEPEKVNDAESNEMGYTLGKNQISEMTPDLTVSRYRPTVVISEAAVSNQHEGEEHAKKRGQWEATVRKGRSFKAEITVSGWYVSPTKIWAVNEIAFFSSPSLMVNSYADVLITGVTIAKSAGQGHTATIQITYPQAFIPQPAVEKKVDPASTALGY